jgi:hypothetical protein
MAEPTQEDVDRVKRITDTIEACRVRLTKIAGSLTTLVRAGTITCAELRAYNLWALSIYGENNGMLALARAQGISGIPLRAPTPTLFSYKGAAPDQAGNLVCPTGGLSGSYNNLNGALMAALAAPASGVFLPAGSVEIIPAGADTTIVKGPSLAQIQQQLGWAPIVWVAIVLAAGVIVGSTLRLIISLVDRQREEAITERTVKVSADNLKTFQEASALRADCVPACTATGQTYEKCLKSCSTAFPTPPPTQLPGSGGGGDSGGSGLGLMGWVLVGAGVLVGGRFAYKKWQANRDGGSGG